MLGMSLRSWAIIRSQLIRQLMQLNFRDWLIDQMARDTIKRVFGSIRSIINLTIKEQGLGCANAFSGTFMPDGLPVVQTPADTIA